MRDVVVGSQVRDAKTRKDGENHLRELMSLKEETAMKGHNALRDYERYTVFRCCCKYMSLHCSP